MISSLRSFSASPSPPPSSAPLSPARLRVASSPGFLRRFRALHPPRLLGFYTNGGFGEIPEFWPVRHPPELAPAVRRAASVFGAFPRSFVNIVDGRDDRLLVSFIEKDAVLCPLLYPARDVAFLPSPKPAAFKLGLGVRYCSTKLLPEQSIVGRQCWEVLQIQRLAQRQTAVQINKFKRGAWRLHSSVQIELPEKTLTVELSGGKFYITSSENIFVLDSLSSTCSVINFPENLHGEWLSKASDSGVYLISVTESLHLRIWLHRTVSSSLNNWLLVDTICLRAVFAGLGFGMPVAPIGIRCVGENAEFVLLKMGGSVFYFNIHCRTVEKLFDKAPGDTFRPFFPLLMIWPPSFPRVEGHDDLEE
ncbi:hypothetical protein QOZ80_2BG0163620 [Eleusine coracana subsp. coracana]|nr:hypothetical protein QOZ80_2BG0163620 [Eleusine coracana subsp. coracana]